MAYFLLEEDDDADDTDGDELVHDAAQKTHLQHLAHEEPDEDKDHDADEHIERSRFLHHPVEIVEHQGDKENVNYVFDSKFKKHDCVWVVGGGLARILSIAASVLFLRSSLVAVEEAYRLRCRLDVVDAEDGGAVHQGQRIDNGRAVEAAVGIGA